MSKWFMVVCLSVYCMNTPVFTVRLKVLQHMAGAGAHADELLSEFKSVGRDLRSIVARLVPFQSQTCGR